MNIREKYRHADALRAKIVAGLAVALGYATLAFLFGIGWVQPTTAFAEEVVECVSKSLVANVATAPLPAHDVTGFSPQVVARIEMRAAMTKDLSGLPTSTDTSDNLSFYSYAYEKWNESTWLNSSFSVNWNCYSFQFSDCNGEWSYSSGFFSDDVCSVLPKDTTITGKVLNVYNNEFDETVFVTDDDFIGEVVVATTGVQGSGRQKSVWRTMYSLSRGNGKSRNQYATSDFVHEAWGEPYETLYESHWVGVTVYFTPTVAPPPEAKRKLSSMTKSQK